MCSVLTCLYSSLPATTYFSFAKDISVLTRVKFQSASSVLIWLQLYVLVAVLPSTTSLGCVANWQCPGERVCISSFLNSSDHSTASNGTLHRGYCRQCGDIEALATLKRYRPNPDFTCRSDDCVCRACYDDVAVAFLKTTTQDEFYANVKAMRFKDWMTVVLTSGVIGLAVSSEIQEITLCELTRNRLIQEAQRRDDPSSNMVWICLEHLNAFLRRFFLLPLILMSAVSLVLFQGGDAMSICFNSVALIFLLECDNLL